MVRKIINELKDFDNLYYEICNEPYFGDTLALAEWEKHMTGIVVDAEKGFSQRHLISNNVANNFKLVPENREGVSIYNFHYARPPVTVAMNHHLNKVIGDNETGFDGTEVTKYRTEAWDFILAGGGLYNNLDYSFTSDNEDGNFIIKAGEPGSGGKILRNQFRILANFMKSIDFINMEPLNPDKVRIKETDDLIVHALSKDDKLFAMYLHKKDTVRTNTVFEMDLPRGSYSLIWIDTKTGDKNITDLKNHPGGWARINSIGFSEDIALKLVKIGR